MFVYISDGVNWNKRSIPCSYIFVIMMFKYLWATCWYGQLRTDGWRKICFHLWVYESTDNRVWKYLKYFNITSHLELVWRSQDRSVVGVKGHIYWQVNMGMVNWTINVHPTDYERRQLIKRWIVLRVSNFLNKSALACVCACVYERIDISVLSN